MHTPFKTGFKKNKFFAIALAVLSTITCHAQTTIKTTDTKLASVDYKRLANIDTLVNGYISRDWVKGVVTIIVKDGQVVQYKGYGYADAAAKKPMTWIKTKKCPPAGTGGQMSRLERAPRDGEITPGLRRRFFRRGPAFRRGTRAPWPGIPYRPDRGPESGADGGAAD